MRRISVLLIVLVASATPTVAANQVADCQKCHANPNLARLDSSGQAISLYVDTSKYAASAHSGLECVACHMDLAQITQLPHLPQLRPVDCISCHIAEGQEFAISTHWRLASGAHPEKMGCATCHGSHDILSPQNPNSTTHRTHLAILCLSCHEDERDTVSVRAEVKAYKNSVHGRLALTQGDTSAAQCVDCHGSHRILPTDNPNSSTNKPHIPETCGRCHAAVLADYRGSIHGKAIASGVMDAPVCTDCHGEHTIEMPQLAGSSVSAEHIPETCGRCHENVQLTEKYGLAAKRFSTYADSYHGLANQYGKTVVANCASCHGYHQILAPTDPASTVHPNNLAATCGKCHPNAGENFAKGKMHVQATVENSPGVFFVRRFYYIFISALMVLFIAYIIIEYTGFAKRRRNRRGA
ncbi:MAG TPA: cytochrome c3 family protein [bacterium]|jgi:hypothetical protein